MSTNYLENPDAEIDTPHWEDRASSQDSDAETELTSELPEHGKVSLPEPRMTPIVGSPDRTNFTSSVKFTAGGKEYTLILTTSVYIRDEFAPGSTTETYKATKTKHTLQLVSRPSEVDEVQPQEIKFPEFKEENFPAQIVTLEADGHKFEVAWTPAHTEWEMLS